MINKMNFENYNDYLLSLNISQIAREFGFKKIGMNSMYLLTNITRKYIEKLAIEAKESTEESNRLETNIIDISYTLLDNNLSQEMLSKYMKESKIRHDFSKAMFIRRINHIEEKERIMYIRNINSNHITSNTILDHSLLQAIPKQGRYFPKDFLIKDKDACKDVDNNKEKNAHINTILSEIKRDNININDKKALEDIVSAANYFDMSKKHTRKKSNIDINKILNEVVSDEEEVYLGKKIKKEDKTEFDNLGV